MQLKVLGFNLNMDSGFRRNDGQRYYRHAGLDPASSIYPTVLVTPADKRCKPNTVFHIDQLRIKTL